MHINVRLYNVTQTAELSGVHPQTLRHYEKVELLIPKRTIGGVRRYTEYDIAKLQIIRNLARSGVNLEGIKIIIAQQEEINILKRQVDAQKSDSVFISGEQGTTATQFSKMNWREKRRYLRRIRKMQETQPTMHIITQPKFLEIEG